MGVLVRLKGNVQWSRAAATAMVTSAGSAKNHSARKRARGCPHVRTL